MIEKIKQRITKLEVIENSEATDLYEIGLSDSAAYEISFLNELLQTKQMTPKTTNISPESKLKSIEYLIKSYIANNDRVIKIHNVFVQNNMNTDVQNERAELVGYFTDDLNRLLEIIERQKYDFTDIIKKL